MISKLCNNRFVNFFQGFNTENCETSFTESKFLPSLDLDDNALEQSPLAKVRCTNPDNVRFQVEPSQNWQLVVLVPKHTNDTEADKYSVSCLAINQIRLNKRN